MKSFFPIISSVFILLGSFAFISNAQTEIIGRVVDEQSGVALVGANVFIANTQTGTVSLEDGKFTLFLSIKGTIPLVVTYVGYQDWIQEIELNTGNNRLEIEVKMEAVAQDLKTVDVRAKSSSKRKRYLRRFEKAFLGHSTLASKCRILNPEVLLFEEEEDVLKAVASDMLRIENQGTGYLILFALEKFALQGVNVSYAGKPLFVPLEAESPKIAEKWEKERQKAYGGSLRHFIRALTADRLEKEGFELRIGHLNDQSEFVSVRSIKPADILFAGKNEYEYTMKLNAFLQIVYKNEREKSRSQGQETINIGKDHEMNRGTAGVAKFKGQVSYLYALKSKIRLLTNGRILQPELLKEYGHIASERVAELMPVEYNLRGND